MRDALAAALALAGWAALTYGLARLLSPIVWAVSVGLLLLGVVGWRTVAFLLWHGFTTFLPKDRA